MTFRKLFRFQSINWVKTFNPFDASIFHNFTSMLLNLDQWNVNFSKRQFLCHWHYSIILNIRFKLPAKKYWFALIEYCTFQNWLYLKIKENSRWKRGLRFRDVSVSVFKAKYNQSILVYFGIFLYGISSSTRVYQNI